jgi:hypothetical protein
LRLGADPNAGARQSVSGVESLRTKLVARSALTRARRNMTSLPLTGGWNCGAVRFEVTVPLVRASYCHCKRCQRRSGAAASANAHPAEGTFRIVAGEDRLRVWQPAGGGAKWFCGDCASSLFGRNAAHPDPIGIRMGAFDGDPGIRPSVRQFVSFAAPWEPIPGRRVAALPREPPRPRLTPTAGPSAAHRQAAARTEWCSSSDPAALGSVAATSASS